MVAAVAHTNTSVAMVAPAYMNRCVCMATLAAPGLMPSLSALQRLEDPVEHRA